MHVVAKNSTRPRYEAWDHAWKYDTPVVWPALLTKNMLQTHFAVHFYTMKFREQIDILASNNQSEHNE